MRVISGCSFFQRRYRSVAMSCPSTSPSGDSPRCPISATTSGSSFFHSDSSVRKKSSEPWWWISSGYGPGANRMRPSERAMRTKMFASTLCASIILPYIRYSFLRGRRSRWSDLSFCTMSWYSLNSSVPSPSESADEKRALRRSSSFSWTLEAHCETSHESALSKSTTALPPEQVCWNRYLSAIRSCDFMRAIVASIASRTMSDAILTGSAFLGRSGCCPLVTLTRQKRKMFTASTGRASASDPGSTPRNLAKVEMRGTVVKRSESACSSATVFCMVLSSGALPSG
mmetsp:Transcript_67327/g.159691  ORF Transcript_67327/g.159691 Transcript_67327/m.159691 type:complete len:286 (+) Transcript_67327:87-944(+)